MDGFRPSSIEVAPLQADGSLYGFMLLGRWPNDTVEWAKFLVLAVQMAAVPGLLPSSTVFRVREDLPEQPHPGASASSSLKASCSVSILFVRDTSRGNSRRG